MQAIRWLSGHPGKVAGDTAARNERTRQLQVAGAVGQRGVELENLIGGLIGDIADPRTVGRPGKRVHEDIAARDERTRHLQGAAAVGQRAEYLENISGTLV